MLETAFKEQHAEFTELSVVACVQIPGLKRNVGVVYRRRANSSRAIAYLDVDVDQRNYDRSRADYFSDIGPIG